MSSARTQARHDARADARHEAESLTSAIEIEPDKLPAVADALIAAAKVMETTRQLLMEPGLASILYRPQTAGLATAAKAALQDAHDQLDQVASNTLKIALLFAQVESQYFGDVPAVLWEQYLDAQITNPDNPLGFLNGVESAISNNVGPASFRDVNNLRNGIETYLNMVSVQERFAVVGINQTLRTSLRRGATGASKQRARAMIAARLGVKPSNRLVQKIVSEYVERGGYRDVDELVARVSPKNLTSVGASRMRTKLLDSAPEFAKQAAVRNAAFADGATRAAARAAGLLDRVPHVAASRKAVAERASAAMDTRFGESLAKGTARKAVGRAFLAVNVAMIPLDVRNAFVADSRLGMAAAGTSAASGALAVAGVATAATGVGVVATPFLEVGAGVLFVTSLGLGVADGRNQQHQYEVAYNKAYEEAFPAAVEEALADRLDDQIGEINDRVEARRTSAKKTPRTTPTPVTVQRRAVKASHGRRTSAAAA